MLRLPQYDTPGNFRSHLTRAQRGVWLLLMCIACLLYTSTVLADRRQALDAQARGDYAIAVTLWQELANQGDAIAQYNLGLLYQQGLGVISDNNLSRYWLAMAARQGLAGAYAQINPANLTPTRQSAVAQQTSAEQWLTTQNPAWYTLQLASSTNRQLIEKYYQENNLAGKAGYYRSRREGEDWFALVYGAYPSVQDAKDAIDQLPEDLKKWSPWVRNINSIHRITVR